ncbi:hypothetical protein AYO21_04815 [Fonsecaea monophora]|uniref:SMP-30/Gluconolactonase/LRE-like region domain-containing protein n=1 Tax=Fonsecaea monophora TaxID=254056 RepID=A0A177F9P2_9EURO|nr:hypothetical protein AYO21_04815 [Fonsecaea monophora]OAG40973.1 hypothetical protein AYO21_04815 [Fonsecaea monophora]
MASFPPPTQIQTIDPATYTAVPAHLRELKRKPHSQLIYGGKVVDVFIEGPIIVPGTNELFVVDIPNGRILAVELKTLQWRCVAEYDGEPNGMAWHPGKKLILIADRHRGIVTLDLQAQRDEDKVQFPLPSFNGEPFKGCNDLVVGHDGSVFFTDQGQTGLQDPTGRVFRWHMDGRLDLLLRNGISPNGLVLSRDEKTLFVAMTRDNAIWALPIYPDGSIQRTVRFSSYYGLGGPDGMTMDSEGNVFVAHVSLGTIFVHKPNGEPLATIKSNLGTATTNLTWGGDDFKTLFITESESGTILYVRWHCKGYLGQIYNEF